MIKNERQYRLTKSHLRKFEQAVAETTAHPNRRVHPLLRKAEIDGMKSLMEDLRKELTEYEMLRSKKRKTVSLASIEELPKMLIKARIAAGLSQEELAAKLGMKAQQIQRYEATEYKSASLERINQVIGALGVKFRQPAELRLVS